MHPHRRRPPQVQPHVQGRRRARASQARCRRLRHQAPPRCGTKCGRGTRRARRLRVWICARYGEVRSGRRQTVRGMWCGSLRCSVRNAGARGAWRVARTGLRRVELATVRIAHEHAVARAQRGRVATGARIGCTAGARGAAAGAEDSGVAGGGGGVELDEDATASAHAPEASAWRPVSVGGSRSGTRARVCSKAALPQQPSGARSARKGGSRKAAPRGAQRRRRRGCRAEAGQRSSGGQGGRRSLHRIHDERGLRQRLRAERSPGRRQRAPLAWAPASQRRRRGLRIPKRAEDCLVGPGPRRRDPLVRQRDAAARVRHAQRRIEHAALAHLRGRSAAQRR